MFTIRHVLPKTFTHIENYEEKSRTMFNRFIDNSPFVVINDNVVVDESAFFITRKYKHFSLTSSLLKFKRTMLSGYNMVYLPLFVPAQNNGVLTKTFAFRLSNTDMDFFENDFYNNYKQFPDKASCALYFDGIGRTHSLITYFITAAIRAKRVVFVNSDCEEFKQLIPLAEDMFEAIFISDKKPILDDVVVKKYSVSEFVINKTHTLFNNFNFEKYLVDYLTHYDAYTNKFLNMETDSDAILSVLRGE